MEEAPNNLEKTECVRGCGGCTESTCTVYSMCVCSKSSKFGKKSSLPLFFLLALPPHFAGCGIKVT